MDSVTDHLIYTYGGVGVPSKFLFCFVWIFNSETEMDLLHTYIVYIFRAECHARSIYHHG